MITAKNTVHDILTEFIEVAIHNILQIRQLYPSAIFAKRQKYGIIVYQIIHPQLKEYISNCIQAIHHLLKEDQLSKIVICFLKSQHILHEKIVFDISCVKPTIDRDPFLLNADKLFRSFLLRLQNMSQYLESLSDDFTFAIQIHTSESGGVAYMENPLFQNFPWIQTDKFTTEIVGSEVVPLDTIDDDIIYMQIYVEKKLK